MMRIPWDNRVGLTGALNSVGDQRANKCSLLLSFFDLGTCNTVVEYNVYMYPL